MANPDIKPAINSDGKKMADMEKNVVCKMFVKGKPNNLIEIVKNILTPLNGKNSGGYYSDSNTSDYKLTILVEKA